MIKANSAIYSSKETVWETPQDFFDKLNNEFDFNLDPCALPENAKCSKYYTPDDDGLVQSWEGYRVFCNPPYGREVGKWVEKAWMESLKPNTTVVLLLPARTDTRWFHDYVYKKAKEIRFVKGRLKFGKKAGALFPSIVIVF